MDRSQCAAAKVTMAAEASTPTTAPWGTRAAISVVVFPFPQPTSRIRSAPLRSSNERTSSAMAACRVEIRAYSEAFHSVIPCILDQRQGKGKVGSKAVSRLLRPNKDREVWFSLGENHVKSYRFGSIPIAKLA